MKDVLIVYSRVDDAGLTPLEFRILGHLARRAGTDGRITSSAENMAAVCGLTLNTVKKGLSRLKDRNILVTKRRVGTTAYRTINPIDLWLPPSVQKSSQGEKRPSAKIAPSDGADFDPTVGANIALQRVSKEGNPSEGSPDITSFRTTAGSLIRKDSDRRYQHRIGIIFGRKEGSNWSTNELHTLLQLRTDRPEFEQEMQLIERFYRLPEKDHGPLQWRRRNVLNLITNWPGELDNARAFLPTKATTSLPPSKEADAQSSLMLQVREIQGLLADPATPEAVLFEKAEKLPSAGWRLLVPMTEFNKLKEVSNRQRSIQNATSAKDGIINEPIVTDPDLTTTAPGKTADLAMTAPGKPLDPAMTAPGKSADLAMTAPGKTADLAVTAPGKSVDPGMTAPGKTVDPAMTVPRPLIDTVTSATSIPAHAPKIAHLETEVRSTVTNPYDLGRRQPPLSKSRGKGYNRISADGSSNKLNSAI